LIKSGHSIIWMIVVTITLALATFGCATKKFVHQQTGAVNARVTQLETKTNQQIAALSAKEHADISRVDERITTTDSRVTEVSNMAQQAGSSAAQANQLAEANQAKIEDNAKGIAAMQTFAENAWNFQMIEKGDVTFAFNKATLDNEARVALDLIAQKAASMPRAVVELQGFTDKVGSKDYNLALSRRRAEAVARYLVRQNIPLRNIHMIGLGKEDPPRKLTSDLVAVDPNAGPAEIRRLARRVYVRVYAPSTAIAGEAARQQQPQ